MENFEKYKARWLRYRHAGGYDVNGNFKPAISFLESEQFPKIIMDVFHELDDLYAIAQRTVAKEKGK